LNKVRYPQFFSFENKATVKLKIKLRYIMSKQKKILPLRFVQDEFYVKIWAVSTLKVSSSWTARANLKFRNYRLLPRKSFNLHSKHKKILGFEIPIFSSVFDIWFLTYKILSRLFVFCIARTNYQKTNLACQGYSEKMKPVPPLFYSILWMPIWCSLSLWFFFKSDH